MPKTRKALSVNLSPEQRKEIERLWFIYGNYGPKQTRGNHSFIQGLLEHGVDLRPMFTKRTAKSERPTPECEVAVGKVLEAENKLKNNPEADVSRGAGLRIVRPTMQKHTEVNSDLKTLLDAFRDQSRLNRERPEIESDSPDAA
jgi:hypothetical protein